MNNISIIGLGYVGLANALLLSKSKENNIIGYDINKEKIEKLNRKDPYIKEKEIIDYLRNTKLSNIQFTTVFKATVVASDYLILCVPTNFSESLGCFDTSILEKVIEQVVKIKKECLIIIKSTVPVGFTEKMKRKFNTQNIVFSPEFLREGHSFSDNLSPSRIIIGTQENIGKKIADIYVKNCLDRTVPVHYVHSTEAEAIKLFSNAYLAMRVSYFNEIDTFAELNHLNSQNIITGCCLDKRIGDFYNNPSFGYGGYCLPKDTKQLENDFSKIPNQIIRSIVAANDTRKNHLVKQILNRNPKIIGVYRLIMKSGSDNFRSSAILDIIDKIQVKNPNVSFLVYEPNVAFLPKLNCKLVEDLEKLKKESDLILANRFDDSLFDVKNKVYTRDIFHMN